MNNNTNTKSIKATLKIVLSYAVVSVIYIYTSDYFLESIVSDTNLLTKLQTYKGLVFIIITTLLFYYLIKQKIDTLSYYYQQLIDVQQSSEDKLESSHEEYMSLFNQSPLPKWIFDVETYHFLLVNEAACSLYGYTLEEYSTMNLRDIRPSEDISELEAAMSLAKEKSEFDLPSIVRHKKKNGEIIYVKLKNSLLTYKGKKVLLASAVDVTTEINAQNKLIEINAKLQLASEIANMGYWTNDLKASKIEWSDEMYKLFEVAADDFELTLENIKSYFHPDYQKRFDPIHYSNFEDNTIKEFEYKIITGTGKEKWLLERLNIIKDINNVPIKLAGTVLDITKRKLYEEEIIKSNERFRMLARATVEVIIDWDIDNNKVMWGEGFHTMLGYDLDNSDIHLWANNIHPEDRDLILEDLNNTINDSTKEFFNAEFRFLKANGEITFMQHRGIFIRNAEGKATRALGAMIDLSETLEKLQKIELQNKILMDIAWMQSHIVRAPLTNLMGFIALFKENLKSDTVDEKLCDYIIESSNKLDEIIHEIVKKASDLEDL